jgi:hypothetical protein
MPRVGQVNRRKPYELKAWYPPETKTQERPRPSNTRRRGGRDCAWACRRQTNCQLLEVDQSRLSKLIKRIRVRATESNPPIYDIQLF